MTWPMIICRMTRSSSVSPRPICSISEVKQFENVMPDELLADQR